MKNSYFFSLFKTFFWSFMDYITKIIKISLLWFVFNFPLFFIIINFPASYLLLIVILSSPFSLSANYYVLQITSQYFSSKKFHLFNKVYSPSEIKISIFFSGIKKYFFKSIILIILNAFLILLLYLNLKFYLKFASKIPYLGLFTLGIFFWLFLIYILMSIYQIPLIVTKDINVFKAIYQSFLLFLDNPFYTIGCFIFLISITIIFIITIAGFVFIFYGFFALFTQVAMLTIYQKYDETLEVREEKRTLKNILKPWD